MIARPDAGPRSAMSCSRAATAAVLVSLQQPRQGCPGRAGAGVVDLGAGVGLERSSCVLRAPLRTCGTRNHFSVPCEGACPRPRCYERVGTLLPGPVWVITGSCPHGPVLPAVNAAASSRARRRANPSVVCSPGQAQPRVGCGRGAPLDTQGPALKQAAGFLPSHGCMLALGKEVPA